jgi:hypothetical protein
LPPRLILSLAGEIYGTPSQEGSYQIGLMVKDSASPPATATASLPLTVSSDPSLRITTDVLPITTLGFAYSAVLQATGGEGPVTWSIAQGQLPAGLFLDASTGAITGMPGGTTVQEVIFQAEDSQGTTVTKVLAVGALNPLRPKSTTATRR